MKIRNLVVSAFLLSSLSGAPTVMAADPVVALMGIVTDMRGELSLSDEQNAKLDNWIAEAPAKREALEREARQLRIELRDNILLGLSRFEREQLKSRLAEKEMLLIEMRSICTNFLRDTLSEDDFKRVVDSYRNRV
ncbi:MAG: hypothetical protein ACPGU7_01230 [Gammaproteobacteria bacterium]